MYYKITTEGNHKSASAAMLLLNSVMNISINTYIVYKVFKEEIVQQNSLLNFLDCSNHPPDAFNPIYLNNKQS